MLIICCGNPDRGDDAAGVLVAAKLQDRGIEAHIHSGEALSLVELWTGVEDVIVVDAVLSGQTAGTVSVWDGDTVSLAGQTFRCSTHALGVAEAIEIARYLARLPRRLRIFGIEAKQFELGMAASAEVARGAQEAAERIEKEVRAFAKPS